MLGRFRPSAFSYVEACQAKQCAADAQLVKHHVLKKTLKLEKDAQDEYSVSQTNF